MTERMRLDKVSPGAMNGMLELEKYVRGAVDAKLLELIRLRASILNGFADCVDVHRREALHTKSRKLGLSVWRESTLFDERERAALALTDAVTNIGTAGVPDDVWQEGRKHWSEKELADITMAIIAINAWNRIGIATRLEPRRMESEH